MDSEFFDMVGKAGVDEPIPLPKPAVASLLTLLLVVTPSASTICRVWMQEAAARTIE